MEESSDGLFAKPFVCLLHLLFSRCVLVLPVLLRAAAAASLLAATFHCIQSVTNTAIDCISVHLYQN